MSQTDIFGAIQQAEIKEQKQRELERTGGFYLNANGEPLPWEREAYERWLVK